MEETDGDRAAAEAQAIRSLESQSHVPASLVKHVQLGFAEGGGGRLAKCLLENAPLYAGAVNRMFEIACAATTLEPERLLRTTGFSWRDMDPTRLDAAFAEIRAINFLAESGFTAIVPLPSKGQRSADFVARRGGDVYAVEVTHLSVDSKKAARRELGKWIAGRWSDGKSLQLADTFATHGCTRRLLIAVINPIDAWALRDHMCFMGLAREAWSLMGEDPSLHVSLVTGREVLGVGRDDCAYPPWP